MKTKRLIRAVELLSDESTLFRGDEAPKGSIGTGSEPAEIIIEFVEEIYNIGGIQELEHRLNNARNFDTSSIRAALELIKAGEPQSYTLIFAPDKESEVDPSKLINKIDSSLKVVEENQTTLGQFEIALRLEMHFDGLFNDLMMAFDPSNGVFGHLIELILKKLSSLSDDDILLRWASLKAQFNEDRLRPGFQNYPDIIPASFWKDPDNVDALRVRVAEFIGKYKPLT